MTKFRFEVNPYDEHVSSVEEALSDLPDKKMNEELNKIAEEKQWTIPRLEQIWNSYGCKHMTDMPVFLKAIVNMNEELNKITAEAAKECADRFPASFGVRGIDLFPIILTVVEKAWTKGFNEGYLAGNDNAIARAARASEG